ncbi:MAG TPA: nitroreductase family protein [Anaerolineaceae bacterium]|nr:nitroreductase family protein [Anaerolineaceae bacterium]HPN53318.1 nitroreductase family protein [Anaerolineaceae bacterium]
MDTYEAIARRQTIRQFAPQPVEPALIEKIIHAGMQAPSHNHLREWHFILLQDPARRQALLDAVIRPVSRKGAVGIVNRWQMSDEDQRAMYIDAIPLQYSMLFNAPLLIFPMFRQPVPLFKKKDIFALNGFASIWCCIENILIAAAAEGIFGVTRIPSGAECQTAKDFLGITSDYEFPCYLALGYPAEGAARARQVAVSTAERIHMDSFNG